MGLNSKYEDEVVEGVAEPVPLVSRQVCLGPAVGTSSGGCPQGKLR